MDTSSDLLTASPLSLNSDSQPLSTDALRVASAQSSFETAILWRNSAEGINTSWSMDGTRYVRNRDLTSVKGSSWQLTATGDYNRDGQDDILWRNSDGSLAWWVMDGTSIAKAVFLTTPAVTDLNWQIAGAGDYNQDGQVDLLWRNKAEGSVAWWVMNATSIASVVYLPTLKDANLTIVGTGDFNQDNQVDLLWRNGATGENFWWVTNGSAVTEKRVLPPVTDLNWKIVVTGDFNGDAKVDLVWRNSSTGANSIWLMNGLDVADSVALPTVADLNWKIVGTLRRPVEELSPVSVGTAPAALSAPEKAGTLTAAIAENSANFSSSAQVSANDLNDFYRFTIAQSGVFSASLTGLTGDADVRLVQDVNQNGEVDPGEVLAWQWERGTISESIRRFLTTGTYYAQVMSYGSQTANYGLTTSFTPAASDDQKFEFKLGFDTQGLSGLNDAAKAAIVDAAKFWESAITSRSAITQSNQLNVTITGKSLVYSNGSADNGTLALSGPQFALDGPNLIISSGISTINARRFAEFNANPTYLRSIMIHEFAHVLGFGTLWEPVQFMDSSGQIFNFGKNLINRTNATYNANTYAGWAYGGLTGSSTQVVVPIEAGAFAHWDETRFDTELMTPYAETPGVATPLSQLTLASLRDLGWNLNFGAAQAYSLPAVAPAASLAPTAQGSQLAAYTSCGCARCLAASKVYTLDGTTLSEAIGAYA
ncbi:hypothetical protein C7B65_11975 [Phormidesmis priestleyi ULC007]|uniref:VCBS repeat-containing protein n=1 Tax=Phormidesmis priestleyi ULC007 TaxID=1920490 RepID=A0A2T1DFR3_9CYAN|nr:VCBS repeat-containing protein [Phormidesmis priestleyi]PSB19284.1 hypothetical protein C7B65_11975 [Phormidesmis priestleyi ULC007]PZO52169.1 MAG: hypothetical protein DCF14_06760 [Phormidesmis priestleyi]